MKVFLYIALSQGADFTHYKITTISRHVSQRMVLLKLENLKGYIESLHENKDEVEKLYQDLLLKVTGFFHDPNVFRTLEKRVIPAILKTKTKGQEIRDMGSGMFQRRGSVFHCYMPYGMAKKQKKCVACPNFFNRCKRKRY